MPYLKKIKRTAKVLVMKSVLFACVYLLPKDLFSDEFFYKQLTVINLPIQLSKFTDFDKLPDSTTDRLHL